MAEINLCSRLSHYLQDLDEDGVVLSLEDVDILLEGCSRLSEMRSKGSWDEMHGLDAPHPLQPVSRGELDLSTLNTHPSGLVTQMRGSQLHLTVPEVEAKPILEALLLDIAGLQGSTQSLIAWSIDLSRVEHVPAGLIARLSRLSKFNSRQITLVGGTSNLQSKVLIESLAGIFSLE